MKPDQRKVVAKGCMLNFGIHGMYIAISFSTTVFYFLCFEWIVCIFFVVGVAEVFLPPSHADGDVHPLLIYA